MSPVPTRVVWQPTCVDAVLSVDDEQLQLFHRFLTLTVDVESQRKVKMIDIVKEAMRFLPGSTRHPSRNIPTFESSTV